METLINLIHYTKMLCAQRILVRYRPS